MGKTAKTFLFRYKMSEKYFLNKVQKWQNMTSSKSKNVWKWTKKAWNCQKSENIISENIFLTFFNLCKYFSDIFVICANFPTFLSQFPDIFVICENVLTSLLFVKMFWHFCILLTSWHFCNLSKFSEIFVIYENVLTFLDPFSDIFSFPRFWNFYV